MTPHISVSLLGTQSDERLASLAGSGHERAFEAIVERYSKALTRYAQRFLGEARAEEVVQAAFLSAWSALATGTEVRDLRPWLYRIVHNGALNAMNRSESGDLELIEAPDGALSPHAILEQNEEVRSALNVIAELPERQRAALLAVAVDGRAHADVAADLGVSDAGVRQLVRRARVQLRTAATALTPLPLALWLAEGQRGPAPDISHRIAEVLADGGGNALASSAMKAGAIVVSVAAVATAAPKVSHVIEQEGGSNPAAAILNASAAGAGDIGTGGSTAAALVPGLGFSTGQPGGGQHGRGQSPAGFGAIPGDPTSADQPAAIGDPVQQPAGQQYGQDVSNVFAPLPTIRRPTGEGNSGGGNNGGNDRGAHSQPDTPPATSAPYKPSTPDAPSTPRTPDRPSTPETPRTPSKPDTTDKPSAPSKPSKPDTTDKPSAPSKPEKPSKPDTAEKPSKPDSGSRGDSGGRGNSDGRGNSEGRGNSGGNGSNGNKSGGD